MDDSSDFIWSFVLKKKSILVDMMVGLIKNLKNKYNLQVEFLHFNNAWESQAFKWTFKEEGLEVDFKYTAPDMPQ